MEGMLEITLRPWQRRMLTRGVAILPALIVTCIYNSDAAVNNLLIISQVIISITLSFATFPLLHFTCSAAKMGQFVNTWLTMIVAASIVFLIAGLNVYLLTQPNTWTFRT